MFDIKSIIRYAAVPVHPWTAGPLEELDRDPEVEARPEKRVAVTIFERILADVFTFTFRATLASNLPVDFEGLVETGLSRALRDYSKSATVDIDMFELSQQSLREKSETEGLNKEEFRILYDLENQSNTTREGTEDGQQS